MSLPPVQPPFGRPQHIDPHAEVRLILKEKVMSLTGDAFDITMDPGNGQPPRPIFKVDPSLLTSKKAFFDMQGNHQFDMKKEHFHLVHQYMKLVDAEGNKFCEVKKNFTIGFGSKFTITFTPPGGAGGDQVFVMDGNWRDSTADIRSEANGQVAARVQRKSALKSLSTLLFDQQTYMVTVAPGADAAVIAAVCIAFDEFENEAS